MTQAQVYSGTPEQLVSQLKKLPRTQKYKMSVSVEEPEENKKPDSIITFGMFHQLNTLIEDDFKSAEWKSEDIELQLIEILTSAWPNCL